MKRFNVVLAAVQPLELSVDHPPGEAVVLSAGVEPEVRRTVLEFNAAGRLCWSGGRKTSSGSWFESLCPDQVNRCSESSSRDMPV